MARPKGRKDTKPRKVNPESLKNLSKTTWRVPGRKFVRTGILLPEADVDAFLKLTNLEKGDLISRAMNPEPYIDHSDPRQFTDMRQVQEIISTTIPEDQFILKGDVP